MLILQGRIRGNPESSVAISTCDNAINGVIFDGSDTFYIHPTTSGELEAQIRNHYLLRLVKLNFLTCQN